MSNTLYFQSNQKKYNVQINKSHYTSMKLLCSKSRSNETGGILIGKYSDDQTTAIITRITGPPSDSRSGVNWFQRGVNSLQSILDDAWWGDRSFYLGEWHFHPKDSPSPSKTDINQMKEISLDKKYCCPEPLLIIVNGDRDRTLNPYVFRSCGDYLQLKYSKS